MNKKEKKEKDKSTEELLIRNRRASLENIAAKYSENCTYDNEGFYIKTKNCHVAVKIVSELLTNEQSYLTIKEIEKDSSWGTILYRGGIIDVKSGLYTYYSPAATQQHFKCYIIDYMRSFTYHPGELTYLRIYALYTTHMDETRLYKAGTDDYYVFGVLPPYQGSLKVYKQYHKYTPRKLYYNE
jgi:hypothetical protein